MAAEGLTSRFLMEELSVMGLMEVLPNYRHLKRRIAETAAAVTAAAPDALITIDSPDFCLRVAKAARAAKPDLKTIHYVAPTVWAWRPGRAAAMAPVIDHVLALFPFEPAYMTAAGMTCDFVGHPVVTEPLAAPEAAATFRETHMIGPDQPLVLCLPGSRRGEVTRLLPRFGEALTILRDREPGLRVVIPTVRGVAPLVRDIARRWPSAPLVVEDADDKRAAFAAADLALAASGTVSLDLAANRVPMVIGYDMNWLSRLADRPDAERRHRDAGQPCLGNAGRSGTARPRLPRARPCAGSGPCPRQRRSAGGTEGRDGPDNGPTWPGRASARPARSAVGSEGDGP